MKVILSLIDRILLELTDKLDLLIQYNALKLSSGIGSALFLVKSNIAKSRRQKALLRGWMALTLNSPSATDGEEDVAEVSSRALEATGHGTHEGTDMGALHGGGMLSGWWRSVL